MDRIVEVPVTVWFLLVLGIALVTTALIRIALGERKKENNK